MVFGLSSAPNVFGAAIACHRLEINTKQRIWKPGTRQRIDSGILRVLRPRTRVVTHVVGAIERALHVIILRSLTARCRSRRCRSRCLRRHRIIGSLLILLLPQEQEPEAGQYGDDEQATHTCLRSTSQAMCALAQSWNVTA